MKKNDCIKLLNFNESRKNKKDIQKFIIFTKREQYYKLFESIVTYVIGAIFKIPMLFLLSIFNIGGCIGDIIMFLFASG